MDLARDMISVALRHRHRAERVNEGESEKLNFFTRLINKYQSNQSQRSDRVIRRLRTRLDDINAYKRVLNKYPLRRNSNTSDMEIPEEAECLRYDLDMRTLATSFTRTYLKPEIDKARAEMDPKERSRLIREKLLRVARHRSNYQIDRRLTNAAINREKEQQEHNQRIA